MADPQKEFLIQFIASCNVTLQWIHGIPERDTGLLVNVINDTLLENNIKDAMVHILPETNSTETIKKRPQMQVLLKNLAHPPTRKRRPSF